MESAWSELTAQSDRAITVTRDLADANLDWATLSKVVPQASFDDDPSPPALLLTDSQGVILGFSEAASLGKWRLGESVTWKTNRNASSIDGAKFGRLVTVSGERTAIIYPLKNRQVVVYATTQTDPSWKQSLQSSLAMASGLGFFWTLSLSAVAIILLACRFNLNAAHQKTEVDHDALRNAQDLLRTRDAVIFWIGKARRVARSRDGTSSRTNLAVYDSIRNGSTTLSPIPANHDANVCAVTGNQFGPPRHWQSRRRRHRPAETGQIHGQSVLSVQSSQARFRC